MLMVSIGLFVRSSSARASRDMQVTSAGEPSANLNVIGYWPGFPWIVAVSSAKSRCSKLIGFTGLLPKIFPTEAIARTNRMKIYLQLSAGGTNQSRTDTSTNWPATLG
jgi:hypothetical protein